jgi:hypothetical protein
MTRTITFAAVMLLAVASFAQPHKGIKPRANAESYPTVTHQPNFAVGAARLSEKQVRKTFVSTLGKKYVVLEVGAFPKSEIQLSPQDFLLVEHGQKAEIREADPETIAGQLAQKEVARNNDITVSPVVGVTYSTGGNPNDPYGPYGGYGGRGWGTSAGVAIQKGGSGQRDPKTIEADRQTMASELKDKQLPEESTAKPVAGYLYFPAPDDANAALDLVYRGPAGNFTIPLQPASD